MKYFLLIITIPFLFSCKPKSTSPEKEGEIADTVEIKAAENVQLKGTVLSQQDSSPVSGVFIIIPGTAIGTMTDNNGNFIIEYPESGTYTLSFSAQQGFESLKTEVDADQNNNIYLIPKSQ